MHQEIPAVKNARLRGLDRTCDIHIAPDGTISRVSDADGQPAPAGAIDAGGNLVLPATIDAHLHLDLAYSLDLVPPNESGTLVEAIRHWADAKQTLSPDNVCKRAVRAIGEVASFGAGHVRTHVDVGTSAGLRLVEGVLAARDQTRDLLDIQIVVFPQDGIIQDPGAADLMRQAMRLGADVIGGIAHNERTEDDSKRHIDVLFELAEEFDADIDCHIDETDDPCSRCVEVLADRTIERGWHGRVTASHVCALSSYGDAHAAKVIALLAEARIHVVTNPGVNLHLQGRFDGYPKRRGLTRVRQLLDAGVNVCAGQDCIRDPFYPLGTGNMFEVGNLLIHAEHMSTPDRFEQVADAITINPAKALRLMNYGLDAGRQADLAVLRVDSIHEAFRTRSAPAAVVKRGKRLSIPPAGCDINR